MPAFPLALRLPQLPTAPFCPSEVRGSVEVRPGAPLWQRILRFAGPGLLVAVGYMDPGNWATDIEAGSVFGYSLLFVVLLSSLAAIVLQVLALRLGLVAQMDLARACRARYRPGVRRGLWVLAEIAIIACDVAEVLGSALALHLLVGVSLVTGIVITAFDTVIVLGLKGKGFRQVEAIVLGLIATIGACFAIELVIAGPDWHAVAHGFVPHGAAMQDPRALYLAIGILGATVMPHNLYLHSSIVQTRKYSDTAAGKGEAIRFASIDSAVALMFALFINAAILIMSAATFHGTGHQDVAEIGDAYQLLSPLLGTTMASVLFAVALLCSGQNATLTGTLAGQIVMEGFINLRIRPWLRRLVTRLIAIVPAVIVIAIYGERGTGPLIILSQVVLSLQLPFAVFPLVMFTSDPRKMGQFVNAGWVKVLAYAVAVIIALLNIYMLYQIFTGA